MIQWYGGKHYLLKYLLPLIPGHKCYVEVFGGSGRLLFAKEKSDVEIYNDIDDRLVNLFEVIQDEKNCKKLLEQFELALCSRYHFQKYLKEYDKEEDKIKKAFMFLYLTVLSFSGEAKHMSIAIAKNRAKQFWNKEKLIKPIHDRLKNVIIENLSFERLIPNYDSEDTFFYCDPPYLHSCRKKSNNYKYEMTDEQHIKLLELLLQCKGKVLLSGYENNLYNSYLKNWNKKKFEIVLRTDNPKSSGNKRDKRIEVVWFNYDEPKQQKLFEI